MTDLTTNSPIPETPILVYPSLAARIGLEEATMLSILTQITRSYRGVENNGFTWYSLDANIVKHLMPFWQAVDIQRVSSRLRELGLLIIASAPFNSSQQLKFALTNNQVAKTAKYQSETQQNTGAGAMRLMSPSWTPDEETLARIAQHNIPREFSLEQVPEFVTYWRERGDSARAWGSKFLNHVIRKWRDFEAEQNALNKETLMTREWKPSADALEVLTKHAGINRQFIEDAVPEFTLFWREKGNKSDNWNKKFRDHVHRQWLRYQSACEYDPTPRRIPEVWKPSDDVYEVLQLANIDIAFAQSMITEFIIYYRDSNQVHSSWNTRFLQYVKQRWASRHATVESSSKSTRDLSIEEQLTDRSWAI